MTANRVQGNGAESRIDHATVFGAEEIIAEIEKQRTGGRGWAKNLFILLISLFIFVRLGLLESRMGDLAMIVVVLLVHEAGHFLGMRLFGYRNVQIFFIPFFGAAVSGENRNVPTYKKAIVSLLGPVPGIFISISFVIVYMITKSAVCLKLAIMFLLINTFNLLPFFPLDGGRFLHEILFSRNRYVELCFRLLASLALAAAGYFMGAWLLAGFGLLGLMTVRFPFKLAGIAQDVKQSLLLDDPTEEGTALSDGTGDGTIPPEIAAKIVERIRHEFSHLLNLKTTATYTREVWDRMNLQAPGIFATAGLLAVYLLCFGLSFAALVAGAMASLAE